MGTATAKAAAPKVSKDELRAQVEKLERSNTTLRTKNREITRAAKAAQARIEELEQQVARLEKTSARKQTNRRSRTGLTQRVRTEAPDRDPGDAVPPGVAVEQPAPLDEQAEAARESLEKLGNE
jgi:DNA repair exonuclease SbcCD ATPase subunit